MMQLKENSNENEPVEKKVSEALDTKEILSLLSKQISDFQKESEISTNVTNLYKKVDLLSLAKSKSDSSENNDKKNVDEENNKKNDEEIQTEDSPEVTEPEKKYTEAEANEIAQKLAKEHYEKGYNLGIQKIKEELQKGDHELALSLKNMSDNLFLKTPELTKEINLSVTELLRKSLNEILGYEIDTNTELFKKKILTLVDSVNSKVDNLEVSLNSKDFEVINNYLNDKKINLPFKLSENSELERADILIKAGSIEVKEIAQKKVKYSDSTPMTNDIEKIKESKSNGINQAGEKVPQK